VQADPKLNKDNFEALANKEYFASDESQTLANNADFTAAMQPLQSDPATSVYCDVRGILALAHQIEAAQSPSDLPQFDLGVKLYGFDSFKFLGLTGGFNGADFQTDAFLGVDNAAEKLSGTMMQMYLPTQTLTNQDYQLVPASVAQAYIGSANFDHYLDNLVSLMAGSTPQTSPQEFQAQIAQVNQSLGLDVQKDLLSPLSGAWAVYQSVDANGVLSDPVVVHPLADGAAFSATLAKVYAQINTMLQAEGVPVAITHLTSGDVPYDTLALPLPGIAPTVSVYKNKFILGFSTQAVLDAAAQDNTNTPLNSNPDLLAIEQKLGVPNSLTTVEYIESRKVVADLLNYTRQTILPIL
ncbi:MAG TPA: hypothetical protein VKJ65_08745, partial [Phycisphaerae bacterium]|nr:hypothetical protein [Phycisphaerae bacterium]